MIQKTFLNIAAAAVVLTSISSVPAAAECSSVVTDAQCESVGKFGERNSEGAQVNGPAAKEKAAPVEVEKGKKGKGKKGKGKKGKGKKGGKKGPGKFAL